MILYGFSFSGYRSFGSNDPAVIAPLQKINFLIGSNNSGKSNIMRLVSEHKSLFEEHKTKFGSLDIPQVGSGQFRFSIAASTKQVSELAASMIARHDYAKESEQIEWLFHSDLFEHVRCTQDNLTWFKIDALDGRAHEPLDKGVAQKLDLPSRFSWKSLSIAMSGRYFDGDSPNIPSVLGFLSNAKPKISFRSVLIPAIRQIGSASTELTHDYDFSGSGIIERLQKLERPSLGTM